MVSYIPVGNIAYRVNLMSAFFGALGSGAGLSYRPDTGGITYRRDQRSDDAGTVTDSSGGGHWLLNRIRSRRAWWQRYGFSSYFGAVHKNGFIFLRLGLWAD